MKYYDEFYECFEFESKNCLRNNLKYQKALYTLFTALRWTYFLKVRYPSKKQSRLKILFEKNWKRFG